jgi:hypothetical protein
MENIYCGNNSLDSDLINKKKILGTRYKCLRKGIGKGMKLPYDYKYNDEYKPIDNRKIYCGKKDEVPIDYDIMGNLPFCLQKGIGIGKMKVCNKKDLITSDLKKSSFGYVDSNRSHKTIFILSYLIFIVFIFLILYIKKPYFVCDKDSKNNNVLSLKKLFLSYSLILIFSGFIIIIIIKNKY